MSIRPGKSDFSHPGTIFLLLTSLLTPLPSSLSGEGVARTREANSNVAKDRKRMEDADSLLEEGNIMDM